MKKSYFEEKIENLSDERLYVLLYKTNNPWNEGVNILVRNEMERRNLKYELARHETIETENNLVNDITVLNKWNWAAFLLAPIWALSHRLDRWAILCFVPFVNIGIIYYLGDCGNKLAFKRSGLASVDDFMALQNEWQKWTIACLIISSIIGLYRIFFSSLA